jgi:hypothetical protein
MAFRVQQALEYVTEIVRHDAGDWAPTRPPDDVLRDLARHPIGRWYRRIFADLTTTTVDGTVYLAVRMRAGALAVDCTWSDFIAGPTAPVSLAEQIVAAARDLSQGRVHAKRFPGEKSGPRRVTSAQKRVRKPA